MDTKRGFPAVLKRIETMRRSKMKRIISIALCALLLLALLPAGVLAAETDAQRILTEAYALATGAALPYEATLTGKIISIKTPYDSYWQNLTVTMEVAGFESMPIMCYRLSGEGAENLAMGDIITVTGTITNYNGTIEFAQGCNLDAAVTGTQTLYCQAPVSWSQCYLYWWGSNVENPVWPGVAMTLDGNGIWGCDLPSDATNVIFHNNAGVQSSDLYLPVYDDVMYVFEMNEWTIYGRVPIVYCYYVAGTAELCGVEWVPDWPDNKMTAAGDGTYYKTYVGVAAGSYDLRVTIGSWEQSWGKDFNGSNNYTVTVEQDNSTVTIYFDPEMGQVSSTVVPAPAPGTQTYYLVGDINGEYYGCEDDADNMGIYRFENGQLTVCFEQDSFVFLKTEGNERWLGSEYYCGLASDTFSEEWTEWMWIPGQVELTLTLTENPDGSVTMGYEWPSEADIIDVAYRLEESTMLWQMFTLTGDIICINTPYSELYDNITVTIAVPGSEDQPIQCFRLSGDGAETLQVGQRITVTGQLGNYKGTIQFEQGCTLDRVHTPGPGPIPIPGPQQIVDEAYALEPGAKLPYSASLTGTITSIDTPYDEYYKNITVTMVIEGRENKPLVCYRLRGEGVQSLKVGDIITVYGTIQNYTKIDSETGEILYTTVEFNIPDLIGIHSVGSTLLYCYAPESWSRCYVYSWNEEGTSLTGDWPGTRMTQEDAGLWSWEVPDNAAYLIFSNGNGSTGDYTGELAFPTDNKIIYVVEEGQWRGMDYLDPDHDGWGPDSLAIAGDGIPGVGLWYPEDPAGDMIQVADNVYTKTLEIPAGTSMTFRFVGNDYWDDRWNFGGGEIVPDQWMELENFTGSEDLYLFVEKDSTVHFTVDLSGMLSGGNATLLVESLDPLPTQMRNLTVYAPDSWTTVNAYTWEPQILGDFPGVALPKNGNACEMQIPKSMVNLVLSGLRADGTRQQTSNISLWNNGEDVTITIQPDGTYTIRYSKPANSNYRVVGNASWMGNWDPASDAGRMSEVSPGKYQKTFNNVQPGRYEFKITKDGKWDNAIGDRYGNNLCFEVTAACDVTITYTLADGKVIISLGNVPVLKGDVTGDGNLNLGDVAKLYGHIRGTVVLTDAGILFNADFNDDGNLNIGDAAGLYAYIRGTDKRSIVDAAYRLEENQEMEMDYTLTGYVTEVVSPFHFDTQCITVRMEVEGREGYPILCTRLTGGADTELIAEGDRITVTGRIRNYYGTVEFKEGCRLIDWLDLQSEEEYMAWIVDQAYDLGRNEAMDDPVTLVGRVISVEQPYLDGVPYICVTIEVQGKEDKPISCYRLMGDGIEYVWLDDCLTVSGILRNFNGIVEFQEGCQLEGYSWCI